MYQKIVIVGNLGGDPEMRYMPDGTPVTSFSVATTRKWGGDNPGEETTWFRVSAWRRQAEVCNQYLAKGRQVMVEGALTPDKATGGPRVWSGQDGQARASFELRADRVVFLGGGAGGDNTGGGGHQSNADGGSSASHQPDEIAEDEIPF